MKKLLRPLQLSFVAMTVLFAVSCSSDDDNNGDGNMPDPPMEELTIYETAVATADLSTLVAAVDRAELDGVLNGEGDFTVFAPTNTAFENLLDALGLESLDEIDDATLEAVLTYHVIASARVSSSQITDQQSAATVNGESLIFLTSNGVQIIDGTTALTNVTTADVEASNGIIHIVDKVLIPAEVADAVGVGRTTIADVATEAGFTSLLAAAEAAGLTEILDSPLTDATVFAPTNEAFAAFLEANDFASVDDVPVEVLQNVLLNHAVAGRVFSTDLATGYTNSLAMNADMDALSLYINIEEGVRINGVSSVDTSAPGESFDIETDNGVIHVVDAVIGLPTVVDFALADPNFTTLVEALLSVEESAGYIATLQTPWGTSPAPFTVFAPTNDAFGDLLTELGAGGLGDIPAETVEATLAYHVIAEANVRAEDITDGAVTTLGGEVTLGTDGGVTITDANGRVSTVIAADVQAINGVIHAIDTVILPPQE